MSSNQPQAEATWTVLVFAIVIGGTAYAIWHFFGDYILEALRWLRLGEVWLVSLVDHQQKACVDWLLHAQKHGTDPSNDMIQYTYRCFGQNYLDNQPREEYRDYFTLSATALSVIEVQAMGYLRWVFAAVFGFLTYYILFVSSRGKFRQTHTLESFIKVQSKVWPVIMPIVNFNPIKSSARQPGSAVPDKLPMFAEALSPEEWVAFHRIPVTNGIAEREAARRALLMQLGPRWNGIEGQPDHIRALFVAFALKGVQKRDESDELLGKIALCWDHKTGLNLSHELQSFVRKTLKDKDIGGKALDIAHGFAWRTTAMLGTLAWARSMGGVLAPAQFLWLRGTDRNLWYALNNLGRRSFHAEGAGALAHYMTERNAKKPLPIPRIDTAIVTLNQYLAETGRSIPPREEPSSKKA